MAFVYIVTLQAIRMKILLHIGQSKTGTSAIQAFLSLNRAPLRDAGVLYPAFKVSGMDLNIAHNAVADALVGKSRFPYLSADQYFSQFFEEAHRINAKLLILSAEHFFHGEPRIWDVENQEDYFDKYKKKVEVLSTYLKGYDVDLLVYLRPQLDWLSSAVSQTVRIERLISDSHIYKDDCQFFELMKPLLMYSKLLNIWDDTINPTSFTIIPYIKYTLYKNSSISDFLYRAGLDNIHFPYASVDVQVNKSLTREYIEVKKILNKSPRGKNTERVIIRCLERLSELSQESSRYELGEEVMREINSFVRMENAELKARYQIDSSFFERSEKDSKHHQLSEADVARAMSMFKQEYSRPRYRVLWLNYATRAFLRLYGKPVHAFLHQLKMAYLKRKLQN